MLAATCLRRMGNGMRVYPCILRAPASPLPVPPAMPCPWQGFVCDLEADAAAVRLFAGAGQELLVAQSFSKSMGLYGERVGALHLVAASAGVARGAEAALHDVRAGARGTAGQAHAGGAVAPAGHRLVFVLPSRVCFV